jgi:hypothetical protein
MNKWLKRNENGPKTQKELDIKFSIYKEDHLISGMMIEYILILNFLAQAHIDTKIKIISLKVSFLKSKNSNTTHWTRPIVIIGTSFNKFT